MCTFEESIIYVSSLQIWELYQKKMRRHLLDFHKLNPVQAEYDDLTDVYRNEIIDTFRKCFVQQDKQAANIGKDAKLEKAQLQ